MDNIRIALDVMGGDFGPEVTLPAAMDRLQRYPQLQIVLVGDESAINSHLHSRYKTEAKRFADRWSVQHAPDKVDMDELPAHALRKKRNSSMRIALDLVKAGSVQACVSAGNTGALMAMARFVLKTLPGIDRPAIASSLPTRKGQCLMLDLGANVDCQAQHLLQFAVMGSVLASAVYEIPSPRVGLLNIGVEQIKGNEQVKEAARYLQTINEINYIGYVEGDGIYAGDADVIVCDGFVGNVALKTSEGLAKMLIDMIRKHAKANWFNRLAALMATPMLKALAHEMDPKRYNGASLLGLRGTVIKSHGGADELALRYAIDECVSEVEHNVTQLVADQITTLIKEMSLTV
ncbi:MAG: phosphate acyltransferase PlsX [Gammaproteobacteria bacterium]